MEGPVMFPDMTYEQPIGPPNYHAHSEGRARNLLFRYLTPEQKRFYLEGGQTEWGSVGMGCVFVTSQSGRKWLVTSQSCQLIDETFVSMRGSGLSSNYCIVANLPWDDCLLGKILLLKYREAHFLTVAKY